MAGFRKGFNKQQWHSPFLHRAQIDKNRRSNVKTSTLCNLERSVNTANNNSLYFINNHRLPQREYTQWTETELYRENTLQRQILEQSMLQN